MSDARLPSGRRKPGERLSTRKDRHSLAIPPWMQFLRETSLVAALRPVTPARRLLIGLPTAELATAILVHGAVAALATHRFANPLQAPAPGDVGRRVSAFLNGTYRDTKLEGAGPGSATVAGTTTMTTYADTVRVLPVEFPEDRSPRPLTSAGKVLVAWRGAGYVGVDPARLHARCAATPVMVIGSHAGLSADLAQLEAMWQKAYSFTDPGHGFEAWFRHPTVVCDPGIDVPPWLVGARPALVICDGPAAWRSRLRRAFPGAAHIFVIDRRSPAGIDVIDEICAANVDSEPFAPGPPPGIEAWRIAEPLLEIRTTGSDEDLF